MGVGKNVTAAAGGDESPTRTGTASTVDISGGDGSDTITVPGDANLAVAYFSHHDGSAESTLASLELNSVAFTIVRQNAEGNFQDNTGGGIAVLANPSTGSQTIEWAFSAGGARTNGGALYVVYVKDADLSDIYRDVVLCAVSAAEPCAVNVVSLEDDLGLAFATTNGTPVLDGTVFIDDDVINNRTTDASEITLSDGTTGINMTGENYPHMAAIVIRKSGTAASAAKPISLEGSAAVTNLTTNATTAVLNLPASIEVGELLIIQTMVFTSGITISATGWRAESGNDGISRSLGMLWKVADGSEGSTVTVTYSSGSREMNAVASRWKGVDLTDPAGGGGSLLSNKAVGITASSDPFTLAADTITSIDTNSLVLLHFGDISNNRTITTGDADLTLLGSATTSASIHGLYEAAPGTGNAAYSIDMSAADTWSWCVFELKAP
jgi:hypothetical protein